MNDRIDRDDLERSEREEEDEIATDIDDDDAEVDPDGGAEEGHVEED